MDRKKMLIVLPLCLLGSLASEAQEVVATAGTIFGNSGGSISFTLGEPVTGTVGSGPVILSQGFQQPYALRVNVPGNPAGYELSVFPNPVEKEIRVLTDHPPGMQYRLFDMRGLLITHGMLNSTETRIDLSFLEPSVYILRISREQGEEKTIKIVKQ
jgi:hypothetical protein